jgi:hypothetical protein
MLLFKLFYSILLQEPAPPPPPEPPVVAQRGEGRGSKASRGRGRDREKGQGAPRAVRDGEPTAAGVQSCISCSRISVCPLFKGCAWVGNRPECLRSYVAVFHALFQLYRMVQLGCSPVVMRPSWGRLTIHWETHPCRRRIVQDCCKVQLHCFMSKLRQ